MKKKTLLLLRHAKSSWNDPELEDYDRPLNSRGRKAAKRIGLLMRDEGLTPNLVLCSTAQRTRETADLVYAESDSTPEVVYRDDLYHAEPKQIARVLSQIEQSVSCVQIIGHNPGLEDFLTGMIGETLRLPTGALVWIDLELEEWEQFSDVTRGTLVKLWRPRELESE